MVADTRTSDDELSVYWESRQIPKVAKRNGCIYGVAGDADMCDLLTYVWEPPTHDCEDALIYMHAVLMPSIKEITPTESTDWEMVIGTRGTLFHIRDKSVIHEERTWFQAVGSGMKFALGHLRTAERSVQSLKDAVKTAAFFDHGTGGKFTVTTMMPHER